MFAATSVWAPATAQACVNWDAALAGTGYSDVQIKAIVDVLVRTPPSENLGLYWHISLYALIRLRMLVAC